jgi:hypothetical protein
LIDVLTTPETPAKRFIFTGDLASRIHATMALWGDLAFRPLVQTEYGSIGIIWVCPLHGFHGPPHIHKPSCHLGQPTLSNDWRNGGEVGVEVACEDWR